MTDYIVRDTQLTSVANAIRTKGGTSDPMAFPDGFVSAVEAIPTGGGPVSVPAKEVNFRDYDGTVVYSYTPAEFAALSAMPANPDHSGDEIPLTSQGWNWSFADAQAYVAKYGRLEVGQMYETTDGKTHILIHLDEGRTSPMLGCCPNGTVDVDWGDGTAHDTLTGTSTSTSKWTPKHNYAAPGDYDIKLTCTGTIRFAGVTNNFAYILRNAVLSNTANQYYLCAVKSVFCASNVIIGAGAFYECSGLKQITIPRGTDSIASDTFDNCYSLASIVIPDSVRSIGDYAFLKCYNVTSISIPSSVIVISSSSLSNCRNQSRIVIPDGVSSLPSSFVGGAYSITSIAIPSSVTNIAANAFSSCSGMAEYHFYRTTPPTLANTSAFNGIPSDCIIYVPYSEDHSILNAYKTATNWSTYASYMQEEPQ